jgi:hypothetical protein
VDQLIDGLHVRAHVVDREHDALGIARRARREYHRQHIIRRDAVQAEERLQRADWQQLRLHHRGQAIGERQLFLEQRCVKQGIANTQVNFLQKQGAGDHVLQTRQADAGVEDRLTDGVVEIDGNAAGKGQCRVDHHSSRRRR